MIKKYYVSTDAKLNNNQIDQISNGIIVEAQRMIQSYINQAKEILIKFPEPCKSQLTQFTELILNRDH